MALKEAVVTIFLIGVSMNAGVVFLDQAGVTTELGISPSQCADDDIDSSRQEAGGTSPSGAVDGTEINVVFAAIQAWDGILGILPAKAMLDCTAIPGYALTWVFSTWVFAVSFGTIGLLRNTDL